MQLENVREFVVFTRYMNFSRAATELHMSQPTLSKHISQLEAELGIRLFDIKGRSRSLTPAGEHFLVSAIAWLKDYDQFVEECKELHSSAHVTLQATRPYYPDEGSAVYYSRLYRYKELHMLVDFRFDNPYRQDPLDRLLKEGVDIGILYFAGTPKVPDNVHAVFLDAVPLGVWCRADSALAQEKLVQLNELSNYKILTPSDANTPFYHGLFELLDKEGVKHSLKYAETERRDEFYGLRTSDCIYVMPRAMATNQLVTVRSDRVFIPLDGELREYAIMRKGETKGIDLSEIFDIPETE